MIPEYHYRVHDDSMITPLFKNWVVAPLFRFVPWWLPANVITIISNMFMYVALFLAIAEYPAERSLRFILIPLLILGYAIGDHLDGMQAKRTGTSSALGELCDHFLDIFNTGIVLYIMFVSLNIVNPALVAFLLTAGYLVHAVIFYEQFTTQWLYFEKIGSLESVLTSCALMMLLTIEPVYRFALSAPFCRFTVVEILFIILSSGTFITFAKVVRRASVTDVWFWLFCVFLIIVACMSVTFLAPIAIFYVITAYSGIYIGNLQRGHLCDGKKRFPDVAVPFFIVAAFAFEPFRGQPFLWGLYLYLACRILWISGNAFRTLRGFWVWKNPVLK